MSFLAADRDIARKSWHALAHPVRTAVWLAAALCIWPACTTTVAEGHGGGTTAGNSGTASGEQGGGPAGVSCDSAKDGDPCDSPGDSCGVYECYGCSSTCGDDHRWQVHCNDPPPCPTDPLPKGSGCDSFCLNGFKCGPYTVQTSCGTQAATVTCEMSTWRYDVTCKTSCAAITDPAACDGYLDCMWIVPCAGSSIQAPMCIPSATPYGACSQFTCDSGETCQDILVNSVDPHSGDCSKVKASMAICTPSP